MFINSPSARDELSYVVRVHPCTFVLDGGPTGRAKAMGVLAKTDKIDAHVIARFADSVRPEIRPLKTEETEMLDAFNTRRSQIIIMLTADKNRLTTASKWTKKMLKEALKGWRRHLPKSTVRLKILSKKVRIGGIGTRS